MSHRIIIEINLEGTIADKLARTALYGAEQIVQNLQAFLPEAAEFITVTHEEPPVTNIGIVISPDGTTSPLNDMCGDAIRHWLGGYMEAIPNGHGMTVFANEDGLSLNLPFNRNASLLLEQRILGPVVCLGPPDANGNTTSLTAEQIDMIERL